MDAINAPKHPSKCQELFLEHARTKLRRSLLGDVYLRLLTVTSKVGDGFSSHTYLAQIRFTTAYVSDLKSPTDSVSLCHLA